VRAIGKYILIGVVGTLRALTIASDPRDERVAESAVRWALADTDRVLRESWAALEAASLLGPPAA
jgi:hypothetical protein